MAKLIPATERIARARQLIQQARELSAPTTGLGKSDFSYIAQVKGLLDTWAQMKAPSALRTKYGNLAWEYTNEGQLSNPTGDTTVTGPDANEQKLIPDRIKQARFNLYLVEHDASRGVHNADYSRFLLGTAEFLVDAELDAAAAP